MVDVSSMGIVLQSVSTGVELTTEKVVNAALLLGGAYVIAKVVEVALARVADRLVHRRFRVALFIPVAKFLIYGTAIYFIFEFLFGLNQAQLIAFAGLFGAAIGFGLKDLVADVLGGLVLVLEQPFQVGDKISLGDHYGEVVNIGVRSTTLRTPGADLVVVPNFTLFNDAVSNSSTGDAEMLVTVEFYISTDADASRAIEIVKDGLITSPYAYVSDSAPATVELEDNLHYRTVRGKAYIGDLRDEMAFKTDVSERVVMAFSRAGMESPKPADT